MFGEAALRQHASSVKTRTKKKRHPLQPQPQQKPNRLQQHQASHIRLTRSRSTPGGAPTTSRIIQSGRNNNNNNSSNRNIPQAHSVGIPTASPIITPSSGPITDETTRPATDPSRTMQAAIQKAQKGHPHHSKVMALRRKQSGTSSTSSKGSGGGDDRSHRSETRSNSSTASSSTHHHPNKLSILPLGNGGGGGAYRGLSDDDTNSSFSFEEDEEHLHQSPTINARPSLNRRQHHLLLQPPSPKTSRSTATPNTSRRIHQDHPLVKYSNVTAPPFAPASSTHHHKGRRHSAGGGGTSSSAPLVRVPISNSAAGVVLWEGSAPLQGPDGHVSAEIQVVHDMSKGGRAEPVLIQFRALPHWTFNPDVTHHGLECHDRRRTESVGDDAPLSSKKVNHATADGTCFLQVVHTLSSPHHQPQHRSLTGKRLMTVVLEAVFGPYGKFAKYAGVSNIQCKSVTPNVLYMVTFTVTYRHALVVLGSAGEQMFQVQEEMIARKMFIKLHPIDGNNNTVVALCVHTTLELFGRQEVALLGVADSLVVIGDGPATTSAFPKK